jgi:hypothetical protein
MRRGPHFQIVGRAAEKWASAVADPFIRGSGSGPPFLDWQEWVPFRPPYALTRQIIITHYTKSIEPRSAHAKRLVEVLVKGGADRFGVVALLTIEQSVPDKGGDLAITDLDRQAAQAMTPAFAMPPHPVSSRFPDGVNLDHWSTGYDGNAQLRCDQRRRLRTETVLVAPCISRRLLPISR